MFASVVIDVSTSKLEKLFDYVIPSDIQVLKGDRVLVPFGNKTCTGYVVDVKETSSYEVSKLKSIIKKLDSSPLLTEDNLRLCILCKNTFSLA